MLGLKPYKGYEGHIIEVDPDADLITGLVADIQDVVNFQARTPGELQGAFKGSVDEYLALCAERGEDPDRPFSGQFVTRLSPEEHKAVHRAARLAGMSLNAWVRATLSQAADVGQGQIRKNKPLVKAG
jgi:predicted HicB family RNase H-like nuclease